MDKVVTTTLLIIAGVVSSIFVFNSVFPALNRSSDAMVSMTDQLQDRMKTRISIVNTANSVDRKTIYIWVKNVGTTSIGVVGQSDVFLGQEGNTARIPYVDDAAGSYPQWTYSIENDTAWNPNATLKITVTYQSDPGAGTYYLKIVIPNGTEDEYYFGM